jgi:hypothetical protein
MKCNKNFLSPFYRLQFDMEMVLQNTKMLKTKIKTRIKNAIMLMVIENLCILQILLKKVARLASKLIRVY